MAHDPHAADYCPTCGQPRERAVQTFERFGLRLTICTLTFGGNVAILRPSHTEFMRVLLEKGRASREFIILRVCPDTESNLPQVYACQLRRIVRDLTGGAVSLRTVWGWGFELSAEPTLAVAA